MTHNSHCATMLEQYVMLQAVIEGYLRPMLADNWDRGSLYSYRAFSFPSDMPYEEIRQPVMFITGEKDGALTRGAKKVCTQQQIPCVCCTSQSCFGSHSYHCVQYFACCYCILYFAQPFQTLGQPVKQSLKLPLPLLACVIQFQQSNMTDKLPWEKLSLLVA